MGLITDPCSALVLQAIRIFTKYEVLRTSVLFPFSIFSSAKLSAPSSHKSIDKPSTLFVLERHIQGVPSRPTLCTKRILPGDNLAFHPPVSLPRRNSHCLTEVEAALVLSQIWSSVVLRMKVPPSPIFGSFNVPVELLPTLQEPRSTSIFSLRWGLAQTNPCPFSKTKATLINLI